MSCKLPAWLPELIDTDGAYADICKRLYSVFERDFVNGRPMFRGLQVLWNSRKAANDQYDEAFWHLTTKDNGVGVRELDTRRAKRLGWCKAIIVNADAAEVLVWEYDEGGGQIRTYLWVSELDYIVVLEKVFRKWGACYMLITGFYLTGSGSRRRMQRKFDARIA